MLLLAFPWMAKALALRAPLLLLALDVTAEPVLVCVGENQTLRRAGSPC